MSMSRVGFEPKIPAVESAETVHDLDRVATVNGNFPYSLMIILLVLNRN
jgi:hypothetical protein